MLLHKIGKSIPINRDRKLLFYLYSKVLFNALNPFNKLAQFSLAKNDNRLIYTADGGIVHGGIIDRLKGVLTTFYLSKKHDFKFHIYHNSPLPFSEVWHHKKINIERLIINPFKFKILFISSLSTLEIFMDNSTLKKNKTYLIYCSENILAHQHPNGKWETLTRNLFNEFNALGYNKIDQIINTKYPTFSKIKPDIVHYRCLNYFGDFEDSKLMPIEKEARNKLLSSMIAYATTTYKNKANILFISDSRYLLKNLSEHGLPIFSLESTKHIDNKGHKKEEYLNAYIENHLITKAKNVTSYILFHKEHPFNSHFAYYPSIIGNAKFSKFGIHVYTLKIKTLEKTK